MFGGFWEWVLIILVFVVIFNADKVPGWIALVKSKSKPAMELLEKGKAEIEKKVAEIKEKTQKEAAAKNEKKEDKKDEE